LIRRRVIQDDVQQRYVFCGICDETVPHLILYCDRILQVWKQVLDWLGLCFLLPQSITSLLNFMASTHGSKKKREGLVMIWNAVVWAVWRHRNNFIFDNGVIDLGSLVDNVKTVSWKWWLGRSKAAPCLLYEWKMEPMICLEL
jgi:hypothetical protein